MAQHFSSTERIELLAINSNSKKLHVLGGGGGIILKVLLTVERRMTNGRLKEHMLFQKIMHN